MQLTTLSLAAALAAVAVADGPTDSFNATDLNTLNTTNPSNPLIPTALVRGQWCTGQRTACSTLCNAQMDQNQCDPDALTWNCTCSSNHSAPGLQWYTTTMPNKICNALNGICMAAAAMQANAQAATANCNASYVCSDINITNFKSSASPSGSQTTGGATATGATSTPTNSKSAAAAALHLGEHYGLSLLGAGLAAAMSFLL